MAKRFGDKISPYHNKDSWQVYHNRHFLWTKVNAYFFASQSLINALVNAVMNLRVP